MQDRQLLGKTVVVTGATAGIGLATARLLGGMGAHVVVVGRSSVRTEAAARAVVAEGGTALPLVADLTSMASVRQLARTVREKCPRLDVLVNNAGGMFGERLVTADGFERTWALNHLSGLLLTLELLPLLKASRPSRVVNVSSVVHSRGTLVRAHAEESGFSGIRAYGRSKLAQIACGYVLARRLAGSGVTVNALHPGVVATDVGREMGPVFHFFQSVLLRPFSTSAEKAARTSVFLASSPDVEGVTGGYFVDCREARSSRDSYSEAEQARVWSLSLSQLGLTNLTI